MQKMKLRNFKQHNLRPESSGPASKLRRLAIIARTDSSPLMRAVMATEPGWYLINRWMESPKGAPALLGLSWLKYQMETAEHRMKYSQPWKKNISQNPPKRYPATATMLRVERVMTGKAMLSGNDKLPIEYKYIPPTIIAANPETMKIA